MNIHRHRFIFLLVLALLAGHALATPITFELSTYGRLQSGPLTVAPLTVSLRYTFDPNLPDAEPSPEGGSFGSPWPALLQIGSESASNLEGVGLFTNFDGTPQSYTVNAVFNRNLAYFMGREIFVADFNFFNFDRSMLTSDALPTDADFAIDAKRYYSTLIFFPIVGDPAFGGPGYTQFNICDPIFTDACVNAPLTLRRISQVPEPTTLSLFGLAFTFLLFRRSTRRMKIDQ